MTRFLIAVLVAVVLGSVTVGACTEVGAFEMEMWFYLDLVTFSDPGSWVSWWYGNTPICSAGGWAIY